MSYYSHDGQVADFTFANETGTRRREVVASVVDALEVDISAGQQNGSRTKTVSLRLPSAVRKNNERMVTNTLVDARSLAHILLPAGVRLAEVTAIVSSGAVIDPKLKIAVGRSCPLVKAKENKIALAGSILSFEAPLSGEVLLAHRSYSIPAELDAQAASGLVKIYNADAEIEGEDLISVGSYEGLRGVVGEPRPFYLSATVIEGNIADPKDISFNVTYILPASEL